MRSLWLYMLCAGFLAIDPEPQLFWHALSINLLSIPKMKLVILSCVFEDYLNIEFLLYVWGSEPFRYIFLHVIGENGAWGPSASPIPSNSFSVTLLLGNLKGQGGAEWVASCVFCVFGSITTSSTEHPCAIFSLYVLCYYVWSLPPVYVKAVLLLPAGRHTALWRDC